MSAADVFNRVAKRCPFPPASGHWTQWITDEMKKTEDLDNKILAVRRKEQDEERRHQAAKAKLRDELRELQKYCDHEMQRGTAECEPCCQRCGYSHDSTAGYTG